ncbi:hypothetical protein Droror1_Dr00021051 [Drosera rotundifolia]
MWEKGSGRREWQLQGRVGRVADMEWGSGGEVLRGPGSVGLVTMASTAAALLGSRWRGRGERERRRTGVVN